MRSLYLVSVIVHILSAAFWVGGMGFFALVVVPAVRGALGDGGRPVLRAAGIRFARAGWIALGLLIVTGTINLAARGALQSMGDAAFWRSPFGEVLAIKLVVVTLAIAFSFVHSRDAMKQSDAGARPGRLATMLGRATLLLSVAAVVLAVFLVRGAP